MEWGNTKEDGNWTGIVGQLHRKVIETPFISLFAL